MSAPSGESTSLWAGLDLEGGHSVRVSERTRIWLDHGHTSQPNQPGTLKECRPGRRVEIKYADAEREVADWIKVEARAP